MRLPTRARYGMRAMLDLAMHNGENEPVLMRDIAARQEVTKKYLEQVLIPLRSAGLIRSVRGAKGGYMLAHDPSRTTLLEIVEACIGDIIMVECTDNPEYCDRRETCATSVIWKEITQALKDSLGSKTLADLMDIEKGLCSGKAMAR